MKYILALDQGTTSSRALIVDKQGKILATAQKEITQYFPKSGWVEHNPDEIWSSQSSVIYEALAKAKLHIRDIAAIGITNQRETTIVWDKKTGNAVTNAIVWQDRRTTEYCASLKKKGLESLFHKKTGLLLDPYFSGTKLRWILKNSKNLEGKDLAFGTVDSYLVWKLTDGKVHATDATNASRTLLYNIHENKWDDELLSILEIPKEILPEVKSCSEIYGETIDGTPISGIAGDQQSALFGQACFEEGMGKITYGTGCFILLNTGDKPVTDASKMLTTIAYQINGETKYALEGSVFIGGAVVQWLRDGLKIIRKSSDVEKLALSVSSTDGVYFVPAFTGLGAPYWNPNARGTIVGLSRGSTDAHIARAALEGIVFQVSDVIEAMTLKPKEFRVDGGASNNNMMMQMQSDLLETPLIRPTYKEVTGLGAAFLAGLAVGYYKDLNEIQTIWKAENEFFPKLPLNKVNDLKANWKKAIHTTQDF